MYGVVYGIENCLNHKIYVGQTINLKMRISQHKYAETLIGCAIRKYGWENFEIVVLEECESLEENLERERLWIKRLDCQFPNGYNLTGGGKGSLGRGKSMAILRRMESIQFREKLSRRNVTAEELSDFEPFPFNK